jgi:hypothetical protein
MTLYMISLEKYDIIHNIIERYDLCLYTYDIIYDIIMLPNIIYDIMIVANIIYDIIHDVVYDIEHIS